MASKDMGLVSPSQRIDNGVNPQLLFHDEGTLRFSCGPPQRPVVLDPCPKATRELTGFIDSHYFQPQSDEFRRSMYADAAPDCQDRRENHNWDGNGRTSSGDGSEDEDDDDDDEDDDEFADNNDKDNSGNNSGHNSATVDEISNGKLKNLSSFGLGEGTIIRSGNDNSESRASTSQNHQQERVGNYQNAIVLAEAEGGFYYPHYLQGHKDMVVENDCGFSGRKESSYSNESGESLRAILSDPLTGALMDDAMILPCGHSFGSAGIQHVIRMKACYSCSEAVSENAVAPNLSLRAAVQAFRREEELLFNRASKRRRERYEQDKGSNGDSLLMDHQRGRGVQFPFVVTDRVIIKGNKRTPQRFVGREAVVTTQCLNGWYVVKTLDNAESVKLQYRSLAKVSDDQSSKPTALASKSTPNWL